MRKVLGRVWEGSRTGKSRQKTRTRTKSGEFRERRDLGKLEARLARRSPEGRRIASRIPPGRIDWVVGGRVVFFVLVVFSVFYVFVGLVAVFGCLLVVWLLGCWFEQPNNSKKQSPNKPMIRQPSYQTTQEHNNPTIQKNSWPTKKSKQQTTKIIRKWSQDEPTWSQN